MSIGVDRWGGVAPSQIRKDVAPPPIWSLESVAATSRPHHVRVSPDRTQIAFILDRADLGSDVWLLDSSGGGPVQLSVNRGPAAFWEDTAPAWSPDGTRIAYCEAGVVFVVPTAGGPGRRLLEAGTPVFVDDDQLVVSTDTDRALLDARFPHVTEVTRLGLTGMDDPWIRPVTSPAADASDPDPFTDFVAMTVHPPGDRNRSDIVVVNLASGESRTIYGLERVHARGARWSPDGSRLAFTSEESGWYDVFVWSEGDEPRRVTNQPGDFSELSWHPAGLRLVATRTERGRSDLVAINIESGGVEVLALGGTWTDPSYMADGSIVAIFEDALTAPRIERLDEKARDVLFDPAPAAIRSAPYVRPSEVTYASPDGLEIHGFLFRPTSSEGPVAAVVYPHGGPTSHYGDEWDGHAQYFVDKGYAWFAINFRGSTSYGTEFERSNHGVWGVADTIDCVAAATYLADLDWIDESRIAIFGASYGSYMALTSLVDDPGRFACGVAKYGDSDILTSWAQGDRAGSEDLERMMGHPAHEREAYRKGSPIHHVDRLERPLLIAHGELDARVHPKQSEELVKELERLNKTFEYVTYPTEGHGLLRRHPQLHFYRRLERFLDWYLM